RKFANNKWAATSELADIKKRSDLNKNVTKLNIAQTEKEKEDFLKDLTEEDKTEMTAIKQSRDKQNTLARSVTKLMHDGAGEDEATALEGFNDAEKKRMKNIKQRRDLHKSVAKLMHAGAGEDEATELEAFNDADKTKMTAMKYNRDKWNNLSKNVTKLNIAQTEKEKKDLLKDLTEEDKKQMITIMKSRENSVNFDAKIARNRFNLQGMLDDFSDKEKTSPRYTEALSRLDKYLSKHDVPSAEVIDAEIEKLRSEVQSNFDACLDTVRYDRAKRARYKACDERSDASVEQSDASVERGA
ncbi:hypothetical protein ScalyP_jg4568, partial [Parmales sp. scaly parma]